MSWTHAQCKKCWDKEHCIKEDNAKPTTVIDKEVEICCDCGEQTASGIYIRRNPADVLYKKEDK